MDASLDGDTLWTIFDHCFLNYVLVYRIIVSKAYCLYCLRYESQIWCVDFSWDGGVLHTVLGHLDLDIDF